eukprot:4637639-Amphidinium_carterae.1
MLQLRVTCRLCFFHHAGQRQHKMLLLVSLAPAWLQYLGLLLLCYTTTTLSGFASHGRSTFLAVPLDLSPIGEPRACTLASAPFGTCLEAVALEECGTSMAKWRDRRCA